MLKVLIVAIITVIVCGKSQAGSFAQIDDLTLVEIRSIDVGHKLGGATLEELRARSSITFATRANFPRIERNYGLQITAPTFFCDEGLSTVLVSSPYPFFNHRAISEYRITGDTIIPDARGLFEYSVQINDETWVLSPSGEKSRRVEFRNPPKPICLAIVSIKWPWSPQLKSNVIVVVSPRS